MLVSVINPNAISKKKKVQSAAIYLPFGVIPANSSPEPDNMFDWLSELSVRAHCSRLFTDTKQAEEQEIQNGGRTFTLALLLA